jgi:CMP-N,N'-diacetyllegionaminic acid synthase
MIENNKILALIPARGKSIELKKKNIKNFLKKPLIKWTIDAVKKSRLIDKVVVSTDSQRILKIANQYKFVSLSKRPKKLSTRYANMYDVIRYEIKKNPGYDIIILLQPTSPLRSPSDIDKSLKLMLQKKRKSCVSFVEIKYRPELMYQINKKHNLKKFKKTKLILNRQEVDKYFYPSGDIYISYISSFFKKKSFLDKNTFPFIIEKHKSIDIDDIYDFKLGEIKLKIFRHK